MFLRDHRYGHIKWKEEQWRAKGTILHEFPLSLMPNKIVKGLKVNGRHGVTERNNGTRGERKSNQLGDANFMEHQLRKGSFMTVLGKTKQRSSSPPFRWGHWSSRLY